MYPLEGDCAVGGQKGFTQPEKVEKGVVMRVLRFISTTLAPGFFMVLGLFVLLTGLNQPLGLLLSLAGVAGFFLLPLLDFTVLKGKCPYCFKELVIPCIIFNRKVRRSFGNECTECGNMVEIQERKFWREKALEERQEPSG